MTEDRAQELREALDRFYDSKRPNMDDEFIIADAAQEHLGCLEVSDEMVEPAARDIQALYNETGVDWQEEADKTFYRGAARAALEAAVRVHTREETDDG